MKKIVASVGLVALGASTIHSASAQALGTPDPTKPWTIAATLRGFYDDNVATYPNHLSVPAGSHRDTFGFEVSPSAAFNWALDQTTINLGVLYGLKYYDHRPIGSANNTDQDFTFNAGLSHNFNERVKLKVADSFVVGQEPDLLRANNTMANFQRVSGDNIRNHGSIGLDAQLTPKFGLGAGYDNAYYDYKASGFGAVAAVINNVAVTAIQPSLSGALDRIENRAHIEGLWQLMPETKGLIGYQFTQVGYTGDEPISGVFDTPSTYAMSSTRNYREHAIYVGAEHNFMPNLTGALRVGASYTDYYNDPYSSAKYTPFVNASLKYAYAPESSAEVGFSYDRNATDVVGLFGMGNNPAAVTVDAESAVVYASILHRIVPNLFGSLMAQFQNSSYNGGQFNNQDEQYYLLGLDLEYRFTHNLAGHVGYNYDRLESNLNDRGFDRNRVYLGITASY